MALRDLKELQREADALRPEEQVQLARYLLKKAKEAELKDTGSLSEFRGCIRLTVDPLEYQWSIRAEWP